jgi:hypothetical protein
MTKVYLLNQLNSNISISTNNSYLARDWLLVLISMVKIRPRTFPLYVYYNQKTQETTFNLIWLNPPKQRIAIYLTLTPAKEYSPEDLIKLLKSMKGV